MDQSTLFALTSAALRGVDVKVLVPKKLTPTSSVKLRSHGMKS